MCKSEVGYVYGLCVSLVGKKEFTNVDVERFRIGNREAFLVLESEKK